MKPRAFIDVDPRLLRLPLTRHDGADPFKLARQIARYGSAIAGMPTILVGRGTDGQLVIIDGVTRAVRVAELLPGTPVRVEVIDDLAVPGGTFPSVGSVLS